MVQNIMLALHCKRTEPTDLRSPIWEYISNTYSPEQAQDAQDDLEAIQAQRSQIVGQSGALPALRETLLRYFRALSSIETRFPISREAGHVHVSFVWYDAFRPNKKAEQSSIHFEKAAVLFNLAAAASQMAVATDRTTDAGVKEAARLFQEAAGAFAYLRDEASLKLDAPRPVDLGPEAAAMLERIMLAQAQECVFEKALADGKSPSLLARIAKQASALYADVLVALQGPPLASHLDKSWVAHATVKGGMYEARAILESGNAFHAEEQIASEIARLRDAQRVLAPIKKSAGTANKELGEAVRALEDTLKAHLTKAERENASVYLQRVPTVKDLPAIVSAMLVKPVPPALDAGGEGLFSSVIPDNSAKALSRYSDMVDAMWREQREVLDGASDEARLRLRQWELPEALQALDAGSSAALPEGIRQDLEKIEDAGGLRFLQDLVSQVGDIRQVAAAELDRAEAQLDEEAREDAELRAKHGAAWNRPSSSALNSALREKAAGYRANLAAAGDSDSRLEAKLASSAASFAALSVDAAAVQMPRLQAPMVQVGAEDPATVVATLRQALDALSRLSNERASLEEALKAEKGRDNILPRIMASSESHEALFRRELSKYDKAKADIAANVERQGQLLQLLEDKQSAFRAAFGFSEWRRACEGAAAGVRAQVSAFNEVRDNLSEGLRFYASLQEAVVALQQHIGDFCLTRRIQREEMVEEQRRREAEERSNLRAAQDFSRMSLGGGPGGSGSGTPPPPPPSNYPHSYSGPPQHSHSSGYGGSAPPPRTPASSGYDILTASPPPVPPSSAAYSSNGTAPPPPPPSAYPPSGQGGAGGAAGANSSYHYGSGSQPQGGAQQWGAHVPPPPPPAHSGAPPPPSTNFYGVPDTPPPQPPPYQQQPPQYSGQPQYGTSSAAAPPPPPQHQQQQQPYGYGGAPSQHYGSYGAAPSGSGGGYGSYGAPPPQQKQQHVQQPAYGYGQQPQQHPYYSSQTQVPPPPPSGAGSTNPLWGGR